MVLPGGSIFQALKIYKNLQTKYQQSVIVTPHSFTDLHKFPQPKKGVKRIIVNFSCTPPPPSFRIQQVNDKMRSKNTFLKKKRELIKDSYHPISSTWLERAYTETKTPEEK